MVDDVLHGGNIVPQTNIHGPRNAARQASTASQEGQQPGTGGAQPTPQVRPMDEDDPISDATTSQEVPCGQKRNDSSSDGS
eukprot:6598135-Lingulodinium_polyedra.AAC.1